jgi:inner membrane transporter RhtA
MMVGSIASLQVGAALAARVFPVAGSVGTTFLRLGFAALVLLAVARPRIRRWTGAQWRAVTMFGLSLAGMNGFFYAAIARIPLGVAVTVEFLGPLTLSALLSRRARDFLWVGLAAAGVFLLGGSDASLRVDLLGIGFALAAAVFWALYILANARTGAAVEGQCGLAVALLVGTLVLAPLGLHGAARAVAQPHVLPLAFATGILASVVPYSLEVAALRRLPQQTFGILLSLEPAVACLSGWLLLSQTLGPLAAAAAGMVVVASVGSTLTGEPRGVEKGRDVGRELEVVPLAEPASQATQRLQLGLGLDSFGDHAQAEQVAELDDRAQQGHVLAGQLGPRDERPVDLQLVDGELAQICE